jgi:hypothetical protein
MQIRSGYNDGTTPLRKRKAVTPRTPTNGMTLSSLEEHKVVNVYVTMVHQQHRNTACGSKRLWQRKPGIDDNKVRSLNKHTNP